MDTKLIGEQITRYRKGRNLTQEELGKAVGVSTQAVSRWENGGAPDVALLPAIADKLGVTIDALFGREGGEKVDMVVSLHACDKATDYALAKAVKWGASVIMAVPCCQHELNRQMRCEELGPVLKYGLIKERMAALVTDALRAGLLEQSGYDTQILEFIDMEHTPKNLMIRAVRSKRMRPVTEKNSLDRVMELLQVDPTLKNLL